MEAAATPLEVMINKVSPPTMTSPSELTPAQRIRAKAAAMRSEGQNWALIAKALNKAGARTANGKSWTALAAFRLVERNAGAREAPPAPVVVQGSKHHRGEPLNIYMARFLATAKDAPGSLQERLETVARLLQ